MIVALPTSVLFRATTGRIVTGSGLSTSTQLHVDGEQLPKASFEVSFGPPRVGPGTWILHFWLLRTRIITLILSKSLLGGLPISLHLRPTIPRRQMSQSWLGPPKSNIAFPRL